jgi:hypothetical protein
MNKLDILKKQLVRVVRNIENNDWATTKIVIQFPPYTNKGFKTLPLFLEANGKEIRLFPDYDDEFTIVLLDYIKDINSTGSFNELTFSMHRVKDEQATCILVERWMITSNPTCQNRKEERLFRGGNYKSNDSTTSFVAESHSYREHSSRFYFQKFPKFG